MKSNKALKTICIIAVLFGAYQLRHYEPIKSWLLVQKAEDAFDAMQETAVETMVTDSVLRAGYRHIFADGRTIARASDEARSELFEEQFCERVFKEDIEDGVCTMAMEGRNWGFMPQQLPDGLLLFARYARDYTFGYLRNYLADPDRFIRFYFDKRDVLVEEFKRQSPEEQARTVEQIGEIMAIVHNLFLIESYDEVRVQYENYRLAVFADEGSNEIKLYYDKVFAFEELGKMVAETLRGDALFYDEYYGMLYLFFARRAAEGGAELLQQYRRIAFDFLDQVK